MSDARTFGEFIKGKRQARGLSLRAWCRATGFDPSNWSKVERGRLSPPADTSILNEIGDALGMVPDDRRQMFDLADIGRGLIPLDLLTDEEVAPMLPVFIRTLRGDRPSEDQLNALIDLLRRHG